MPSFRRARGNETVHKVRRRIRPQEVVGDLIVWAVLRRHTIPDISGRGRKITIGVDRNSSPVSADHTIGALLAQSSSLAIPTSSLRGEILMGPSINMTYLSAYAEINRSSKKITFGEKFRLCHYLGQLILKRVMTTE